jgi:hypothetical protein
MKLGIMLQYWDSRNDVRLLVEELARRYEVVLLAQEKDRKLFKDSRWNVRYMANRGWFWPRFWGYLFMLFGHIPRSQRNYYVDEYFKLEQLPPGQKLRMQLLLGLSRIAPKFLSFEAYARRLASQAKADVSDLDALLAITEICDPGTLGKAQLLGKPTVAYVYSWDHAPKHKRMSRHLDWYFTWNAPIGDDLVELQGVPAERIKPVGSTQLTYVIDYLQNPLARRRQIPYDYVYFGCATGSPQFVRQEVRIIIWVAKTLAEIAPEMKLLVRPYPFLSDWTLYEPLRQLPNVAFDDDYRQGATSRALTPDMIAKKFNRLEHASAFVHLGTTLGFECAYFDTPMLFLAPENFDFGLPQNHRMHLRNFFGQYHLKKYLQLEKHLNVVTRQAALLPALTAALNSPRALLAYNEEIRAVTPLKTLSEIVDVICSCLKPGATRQVVPTIHVVA